MDTNFSIKPYSFKAQQSNVSATKKSSPYMSAANFGLQRDTVSFSGGSSSPSVDPGLGGVLKLSKKAKAYIAAGLATLGIGSAIAPQVVDSLQPREPFDGTDPANQNNGVNNKPVVPNAYGADEINSYGIVLSDATEDMNLTNIIAAKHKVVTFKPIVNEQRIVTQREANLQENRNDASVGSSVNELVTRAWNIENIFEQSGVDISDAHDASYNAAFHAAIEEMMQSSPELVSAILEVNDFETLDELKEHAASKGINYYDLIARTPLEEASNYKDIKVTVPTFKLPIIDTSSISSYARNTSIVHFATDLDEIKIDTESDGKDPDVYTSLEAAIAKAYQLDPDSPTYERDLNALIFFNANSEDGMELLGDEGRALTDNGRKTLLAGREGAYTLKLQDNVLISSIAHENDGNVEYIKPQGEIYQITPTSSLSGARLTNNVARIQLPLATEEGMSLNGFIASASDSLKYYTLPGGDKPMMFVNDNNIEVFNLRTQEEKDAADAVEINFVMNNLPIYTAAMNFDDPDVGFQFFGAFDIIDVGIVQRMQTELNEAAEDGVSFDDAVKTIREGILRDYADGRIEDFIEKYGRLNKRYADIEFYDVDGTLRFVNADGSPVTVNITPLYLQFAKNDKGAPAVQQTKPGPTQTTNTGPGPDTNTGTGTGTDPGPDTNTGTGTGTGTDPGPDTNTGTGTGTGTDPGPDTNTGTGTGTGPGPDTNTGTGTGPGPNTNTGTGTGTGSDPGKNPDHEVPTGSGTGTPTSIPSNTGTGTGTPTSATNTNEGCDQPILGGDDPENIKPSVNTGTGSTGSGNTGTGNTGTGNTGTGSTGSGGNTGTGNTGTGSTGTGSATNPSSIPGSNTNTGTTHSTGQGINANTSTPGGNGGSGSGSGSTGSGGNTGTGNTGTGSTGTGSTGSGNVNNNKDTTAKDTQTQASSVVGGDDDDVIIPSGGGKGAPASTESTGTASTGSASTGSASTGSASTGTASTGSASTGSASAGGGVILDEGGPANAAPQANASAAAAPAAVSEVKSEEAPVEKESVVESYEDGDFDVEIPSGGGSHEVGGVNENGEAYINLE